MQIFAKTFLSTGGIVVTHTNNTVKLTMSDNSEYVLEVPTTGYFAFFKKQDGSVVSVDGETLVMMRDAAPYLRSRFAVIDPKIDALATSFNGMVIVAGAVLDGNAEAADPMKHNLEVFGEHSTDAAALFKRWKARRDYLFDIDPISSITALERQVDCLTAILATLVPNNADLKRFIALSSANPDTIDSAVEFKQQIRQRQVGYTVNKQ